MKTKKLLIVSDSPMWQKPEGVVVFEPTLREVEMLTQVFDEIIWIGFANPSMKDANSRTDRTGKIKFHLLSLQGGGGLINKLKQVLYLFKYCFVIYKYLRTATYVHTRAPSVPALLVIYLSLFDKSRKYWHKFAGNWMQENAPKSYALQKRLMLKAVNTKVTVNGFWENQPKHILAFENPCFTADELKLAFDIAHKKTYTEKLNLLFVGRIEEEKGLGRVMDALMLMNEEELSHINQIKFVGKGRGWDEMNAKAKLLKVPYTFTGALSRELLEKEYASSHLFLLPSNASEGFPKVIAESAAFGCLQCVSSVSSVTFYVHDLKNGIVFKEITPESIKASLVSVFHDRVLLEKLAREGVKMADVYTYERYNERIEKEVFELDKN
ncbi:MAG: glycosyltransferase [Bacteroidetes bacterium]|nr:glycosyltransferase [Bacteroidota bacterium]